MTFTKEQLTARATKKISTLRGCIMQSAYESVREKLEIELRLAEITLASLEADPVAFVMADDLKDSSIISTPAYRQLDEARERTVGDVFALYTAPPAPVSVLDEKQSRELFEKWCSVNIERNKWHPEYYAHYPATGQWGAWEACRVAMLQGSDPASQHDELPANVIDALEKALQAMSFMGDTLNALDAVCEEDVEYVTPAFEAVRQVLEGNSPVIPDGWTGSDEANAALIMLDRIETVDSVDDDRIEGIKRIIRGLAAAPQQEVK